MKESDIPLSVFISSFCGFIDSFLEKRDQGFGSMIIEDELLWEEAYYIISAFAELLPILNLEDEAARWLFSHYRAFRDYAGYSIIPDCQQYSVSVLAETTVGGLVTYTDNRTLFLIITTVIDQLESVMDETCTSEKKAQVICGCLMAFAETNGAIVVLSEKAKKRKEKREKKEKRMRKEDGYWIDDRGNRWARNIYTEERAQKLSEGMTECKECVNCEDCFRCIGCIWCDDCRDRRTCDVCRSCETCQSCKDCMFCKDCSECLLCHGCEGCEKCRNCTCCKESSDCMECSICSGCEKCRECYRCSECTGCKKLKYAKGKTE